MPRSKTSIGFGGRSSRTWSGAPAARLPEVAAQRREGRGSASRRPAGGAVILGVADQRPRAQAVGVPREQPPVGRAHLRARVVGGVSGLFFSRLTSSAQAGGSSDEGVPVPRAIDIPPACKRRHCERSEASQSVVPHAGLLRYARKDGWREQVCPIVAARFARRDRSSSSASSPAPATRGMSIPPGARGADRRRRLDDHACVMAERAPLRHRVHAIARPSGRSLADTIGGLGDTGSAGACSAASAGHLGSPMRRTGQAGRTRAPKRVVIV